jgi:hypothetical protein
VFAVIAVGSAAYAEDRPAPAAIAHGGDAQVRAAFDQFAQQWMVKVEKNALPAPNGGHREYADYSIELRATGQSSAPYVGLLRYTENLVECSAPGQCTATAAIPVTEIFRFERGRWVY